MALFLKFSNANKERHAKFYNFFLQIFTWNFASCLARKQIPWDHFKFFLGSDNWKVSHQQSLLTDFSFDKINLVIPWIYFVKKIFRRSVRKEIFLLSLPIGIKK